MEREQGLKSGRPEFSEDPAPLPVCACVCACVCVCVCVCDPGQTQKLESGAK